MRPGLLPAYN